MDQNHLSTRSLVLLHHSTELGGAELSLLRILEECPRLGVQPFLATSRRGALFDRFQRAATRSIVLPFPFPRQPLTWRFLPRFLWQMRRFLRDVPAPAILFSGDFYTLWAALWLQQANRPVHSLWQGEYDFSDDGCARKWRRYGAARASALFASAPIAGHLNRLAVLPQTAGTLNPFVDLARFDPARLDRAAARQALGWNPGEKVAICAGRIGPGKGQAQLAEAFARDPRCASWRLLFAGPADPEPRAQLAALAAATPGGRVVMLGPRDDVPLLLAASDLAVHPTLLQESFGLFPVEASLMKLPVVAFASGALPDILGARYPGLVSPGDFPAFIATWMRMANWPEAERDQHRAQLAQRFSPQAWESGLRQALGLAADQEPPR